MWYIYTVEYYSAVKNELMLFAITWKDLEIIILTKVSQREINDIAYTWNLKEGGWINKTEIDPTDIENKFMVTKWKDAGEVDKLNGWD